MNAPEKPRQKTRFDTIGKPRRRVDGRAKAIGELRFADDLVLPRMLHAKLLRSPHRLAYIRERGMEYGLTLILLLLLVGLPLMTVPCCMFGTMNGSAGWSPTCVGVFIPCDPITATALPPIVTVGSRPINNGAEKGIGGPGCGAPEAGFGIWWIAH